MAVLKSSRSVWSDCPWRFPPPNGTREKSSISPWPGFKHGRKAPLKDRPGELFASHFGFRGAGAGSVFWHIRTTLAAWLDARRTSDVEDHRCDFFLMRIGSPRAAVETRLRWRSARGGDLRQLVCRA